MEAHPDLVQFRLTHDARKTQQQAVVVDAWIVKPLTISN
jgi:hypothetical protein